MIPVIKKKKIQGQDPRCPAAGGGHRRVANRPHTAQARAPTGPCLLRWGQVGAPRRGSQGPAGSGSPGGVRRASLTVPVPALIVSQTNH